MIKNITEGPGIKVHHANSSWPTFYNNSTSSNNTLVGQMRYSGSNQCVEVYDGVAWLPIPSSYPQIELNATTQAILQWAEKKMEEESRVKELAAKHPTVADALEAVTRATEQLKIVAALVDSQ